MSLRAISADSHVMEPPNCYIDHIEARFRDRAPRMEHIEGRGCSFIIDGMENKAVPMGLVAAAGVDPKDIRVGGAVWEDLHRGGWDPKARIADQDRDGVVAEFLYASVGMLLAGHPDLAYRKACMEAYNRWLAEFCAAAPERLFGLPQVSINNPEDGVKELQAAADAGFRGVMMPGLPGSSDYDDPAYDALWEAAVGLDLPLSFHILTAGGEEFKPRGPKINAFQGIIRLNQDILGMLVYSGVFERHPGLKVVCVEADVGWLPHYMYRMDHAYKRHRYWMKGQELARLPSEYVRENIYLTFQDDWTAFRFKDECNIERLMWANDFPHSDSTWPWSQDMLAEHAAGLSDDERRLILHDNCAALYGLPLQRQAAA